MPGRTTLRVHRWLIAFSCAALACATLGTTLHVRAAPTWTVNSTADTADPCSGSVCTLRGAITAANAAGGGSIQFNIPPGGPQTIEVGSGTGMGLPEITANGVTIDATTQPGITPPGIRIDDPNANDGESGIVFDGSQNTVRGLIITNFHAWGILIRNGAGNNVVAGNWVGTADGVTAAGVGNADIDIEGPGGNNTIGGTTSADRNVFSGSLGSDGVHINSSNGNVVTGNYVGMTADGISRLPNAATGIGVDGKSSGNRIGGTTPGERNVVSGENGIGVQLLGALNSDGTCVGPSNNVIEGNWLGVNSAGNQPGPYGNHGEGVMAEVCAHDNVIGGTAPGAGNVIAGNKDDGIQIDGVGSPANGVCNNTVQGNVIGLDPTGIRVIPNTDAGVKVQNGACNTLVGGSTPGAGNVISGNDSDGVYVDRPHTSGTQITGNIIGLGSDGRTPLGNQANGVHIFNGDSGVQVTNNIISGNVGSGVLVSDPGSDYTVIKGNKIGADVSSSVARGNGGYGVWIYNGPRNANVTSNVITGNIGAGVAVQTVPNSGVTTLQDRISGNAIRSNGGIGIDLLPVPGVNANDGVNNNSQVGNSGIDYPVISAVSSNVAKGTAPPGSTVELFAAAPDQTNSNGEGASYLGSAGAAADGSWCIAVASIPGSVTATATDAAGDTSEFAADAAVGQTALQCPGSSPYPTPSPSPSGSPTPSPSPTPTPSPTPSPGPSVLFSDTFTAANGSPDSNFQMTRSAAGSSVGATIVNNQYQLAVALASLQVGTWQYVQARELPVTPSWSTGTIAVDWQMSTNDTIDQTASLVLTPTTGSGNCLNQPDYLRVRAQNGTIAIVRRVSGGSATTIWWGSLPSSPAVQEFRLQIDGTNLWLYGGAPGGMALLVGPLGHGLSWSTAYVYLHASNDAAATWNALFDNVEIDKM